VLKSVYEVWKNLVAGQEEWEEDGDEKERREGRGRGSVFIEFRQSHASRTRMAPFARRVSSGLRPFQLKTDDSPQPFALARKDSPVCGQ
jgi:hypothetical protein